MCVCVRACTCSWVHVCVYVCAHMYMCAYVCLHICVHVYIYIYMCVCVCVFWCFVTHFKWCVCWMAHHCVHIFSLVDSGVRWPTLRPAAGTRCRTWPTSGALPALRSPHPWLSLPPPPLHPLPPQPPPQWLRIPPFVLKPHRSRHLIVSQAFWAQRLFLLLLLRPSSPR